jgi:2-polyprenyl-3-methyl-5-hydroxy-6-metoxy-1,4-benzoquinol methylase
VSHLPRVGREISAARYWAERAGAYSSGIAGPYHAHRLDVVEAMLDGIDLAGLACVDFGCGEGVVLERLARRGADVVGLDPVDEMVAAAGVRLVQAGLTGSVRLGGVDALAAFDDGSIGLVVALNVAAYFTDEEESAFYSQTARILRPGGSLLITHSNELFDLYTLNRYSAGFFERHFDTRVDELLAFPDRPERVTFNVRENPLAYRFKLAAYGLEEVRQEFINLHPAPPLLMDPRGFEEIDTRDYAKTLDWPETERWKLLFQCSMFASLSRLALGRPALRQFA